MGTDAKDTVLALAVTGDAPHRKVDFESRLRGYVQQQRLSEKFRKDLNDALQQIIPGANATLVVLTIMVDDQVVTVTNVSGEVVFSLERGAETAITLQRIRDGIAEKMPLFGVKFLTTDGIVMNGHGSEIVAEAVNQISDAAKSGDGSTANVGIKMTGTFQCPDCRQKFDSEKAK